MGRTKEYYDMPTVRKIVRDAAAKNYKFSAIVLAVVNSDQFKMHRAPQPAPAATSRLQVSKAAINKETTPCSCPRSTFLAVAF